MLSPKKVKFRKFHKQVRQLRGVAGRGAKVSFGDYGLMALEGCWITGRQIEAARVAINRHVKKHGKLWIRIYPDRSLTKKPAEVRMGKGKGPPEMWVASVQPGRIIYELTGVDRPTAEKALSLAAAKLPIKTRMVTRV